MSNLTLSQGQDSTLQTRLINDFQLSDLFKNLACEQINDFTFDDVSLTIATDNKAKLEFAGNLKLEGPLTLFKDFLDCDQRLPVRAELTTQSTDTNDKVEPQDANFSCSVPFYKVLFNGVTLDQVKFNLSIKKGSDNQWTLTPKLTGNLEVVNITDDSNATIAFDITIADNTLLLNASAKQFQGAFGINNLMLDTLSIEGQVGKTDSLAFCAELQTAATTFNFNGNINQNAIAIVAKADQFDINELANLFAEVAPGGLTLPRFDISFSNTSIALATQTTTVNGTAVQQGFSLITEVNAHQHTIQASAQISSKGVSFKGVLADFSLGPVEIKQTSLNFEIYRKSENKPSKFEITGQSVIEGIDLDVVVSFIHQDSGWTSLLAAQITADNFGLGNIFKGAKNSFVGDLTFSKVCFIYASAAASTTVGGQDYNVKSGLQLMGVLEEIPGLSDLTGEKHIGMVLCAHIGKETDISVAIPDTRLNLGNSITCDPFTIEIDISPKPALSLVFGMDVDIPKQTNPLHFDMKLTLDAIGATGSVTMKNYWKNPFGINGIKIGPAVALQLGIIYEQFITTGTPSEFGILGGLEIGDTIVQMAVNISADPTKEILMGKLEKLNPSELINFATNLIDLDVPKAPNFFEFKNLELYCAPTGGSIGTVSFEPGFSFSADLEIAGKNISFYSRISDNAIEGAGHIDNLTLGPLAIKGENGKDASVGLTLSTEEQSLMIDGAFSFLGLEEGIYVDISNEGVEFKFEQDFFGQLTFEIEGKSSGSLAKPKTMDFALSGEMDNNITQYLKTQVKDKIDAALDAAQDGIDSAQAKVSKARKAYQKRYNPAKKSLDTAQKDADAYLDKLTKELSSAKSTYAKKIDSAEKSITNAKQAYDQALTKAQNDVDNAEKKYNNALNSAQDKVNSAQRTYDNGITNAQNDVINAQNKYNNAIGSAQKAVTSASNKCNSLLSEANALKKKIKKLKWYEKPAAAAYGTELAGVYTAYGTAKAALATANATLEGIKQGGDYAALGSANAALQAAKTGANYTAFTAAKASLQAVKTGGDFAAFESAKATLSAIKQGSEYTVWQTAQTTLSEVKVAGEKAISAASTALDNIGKSTAYIALQSAKASLNAIEQGTEAAAFGTAKAALAAAKAGSGAMLKLASYIAEHAGDIIDIKSFSFSGSLKAIEKGDLFKAELNIALLGKDYDWTLDFNVKDVTSFIDNLFDKALKEIENID